MQLSHVIILSVLQGFSELFPISSLGHTVLVEALLDKNTLQNTSFFLAFVVALHIGTSIALLIFFAEEWKQILIALYKTAVSGKFSKTDTEHFAWLLVIGTIPVGLIGLVGDKPLKHLFASPKPASIFLVCNGVILFLGEKLRQRENKKTLRDLSYTEGFGIGLSQSLALLPGISRSGVSMVSGLLRHLSHEDAAHLSFMLATPVIFAAGILEIPTLFALNSFQPLFYSFIGAVIAGITAYFSVKFLMKYFQSGNLMPYAYYSIIVGIVALIYFK